jgi:hypothetical protein
LPARIPAHSARGCALSRAAWAGWAREAHAWAHPRSAGAVLGASSPRPHAPAAPPRRLPAPPLSAARGRRLAAGARTRACCTASRTASAAPPSTGTRTVCSWSAASWAAWRQASSSQPSNHGSSRST